MSHLIQNKEELEKFITQNWNRVNQYLDEKMTNLPVPIYTSVDIRESRDKYAPVDNNIYPAGFNNLCQLDLDEASEVFRVAFEKEVDFDVETVGIVPESHTKNLFYLDHLAILGRVIRDAGFDVVFLGVDHNLFTGDQTHLDLVSHSGYDIRIDKASIVEGRFQCTNNPKAKIDLAILNNDQSKPLDIPWDELKTPVCPPPNMGWFQRQKIEHFACYKKAADDFCEHFQISPDLIQAKYRSLENVDFLNKEGLEKLGHEVDELLKELPEEKQVFVKASQGTYGMGISVVKSGEEMMQMNRKLRNKMDVGKNRMKFTSALIQEGIETVLKYDEMPAEVTIYLVKGKSVGGFMRANTEKDTYANLNSRGMVFRKFCISEIRQNQDHKAKEAIYTIIARLSNLAGGMEVQNRKESL